MTTAFTVRLATVADAAKLSALATRTYIELVTAVHAPNPDDLAVYIDKALSVEKMQAELEDPSRFTVFVFPEHDPESPCGYSMICDGSVRPGDDGQPDDHIEIKRVYVDSAFHGTGAAYILMKKVMQIATSKPRKVVWLGTAPKNVRAQKFYRKHGFEVTGDHPFPIGDSVFTDVVLTLQA